MIDVGAADVPADRPLCADVSAAAGETLGATASRIEHWLLVEYGGYWPYEPLDAAVFAGSLAEHLRSQLAALPRSRLLLLKRPGRGRRDRVRIFYGSTPERGGRFFTLELEGHPDLLGLDLVSGLAGETAPAGEPLEHPLLLVCTHGKRDRCCARYGQRLCAHLHAQAPAGWVWQSSHVGGDRFAGNLLCLPEGLYFGRLDRRAAARTFGSYLTGRIELDHYRGRSCYAFAVQAAEFEVRCATGLSGFHDLRLVSSRRVAPDRWSVELLAEVAGVVHAVDVALELGPPAFLTCKAAVPRRAHRFVAVAHAQRAL